MVGDPDQVRVEVSGISKRFGGVQALADVDLAIEPGTIHGLVGENGAGKSTLAKIIAGVTEPDQGVVRVDGREVRYRSPHQALRDGITMIAQELALVPAMSVAANVLLGTEACRGGVLDGRRMRRRYRELCETTGFDLPANVPAGQLRVADQQKVEVMRALGRGARLIIMDEPTAPLTPDETERLFADMRRLREQGRTIVFISHFLDEVLSLCDSVTIMRDGALVRTRPTAEESSKSLITGMLGRSLDVAFPPKAPPPDDAPVVCSVRGLTRPGVLDDVSLDLRRGEIVGLAGLIGAGRTEVARAIFGADRVTAGTVEVDGRDVTPKSPRQAIEAGIAMLPESRKEHGLLMTRTGEMNISLPHLPRFGKARVNRTRERAAVAELADEVGLAAGRQRAPVSTLSGGNQQKVLFAKWLLERPKVLIADEPTRGVDVGAKRSIYELLIRLASEGMAVLVISSELEEVLGLAHRVLVMRAGRIVAEIPGDAASEENVMNAAFGETDSTPEGT